MRLIKASSICCAALCVVLLAGCDVTTPSQIKTANIQLKDVMKTATLDPAHMNHDNIESIAGDYDRNGSGPMRLVVPYKPGDPLSKVAAEAGAAQYEQAFAAMGVKDFRISYTATVDSSAMPVLSYMALSAEPPRDCKHMQGYYGAEVVESDSTDLSCEMKTAESKMVARPADLLGNPGLPEDDARRQGTMVEKYKAGVPNPALNSLKASGIGG